MEIKRYITGPLATNTYLLTEGDYCLLIDPASRYEKMMEIVGDKKLLGVLLTHGHFDHIKAVDGLYDHYQMPIYLNSEDEKLARNSNQGRPFMLNNVAHITKPIEYLKEGRMKVGPFEFEVYFTPGHSKGSVCYDFGNDLFTGDTLFCLSAGRTDLEGGSDKELKSSLRFLASLEPTKTVHPGHEDETNLDFEIRNNPYM